MTVAIASGLVTAIAIGLWFSSSRPLAIVACALIVAAQPWLVLPICIGSATLFYIFHLRK